MAKKDYSEKVITAFLEHDKISDIVSATGLSRTTIFRYKNDPELQKILCERKSLYVEAAVAKMQKAMSESADVLQRIISNEDVAPQVRVNAISVLFTQCRSWVETQDILKRIEVLETER